MFNIFPASVPISTMKKVLEVNCVRKTTTYIPVNSLWITKSFIQLANNESDKTCLTIDCTGLIQMVLEDLEQEADSNKILFEIEGLETEADNEIYSASLELENLQGNGLSNVRAPANNSKFGSEDGNSSRKFRIRRKSARPKFLSR